MNKENDPLDKLFNHAKLEQEKVAAAVEMGVESRLSGQLNDVSQTDTAWLGVLNRLCGAGALLALCLFAWVASEHQQTQDLASYMIECWLLGI